MTKRIAVLVVILGLLLSAEGVGRAVEPVRRLAPGDYRLEGEGQFRRIVVSGSEAISYDIWRVTESGKVQYLHFALVSPAKTPIESDAYVARSRGENCGLLSVRIYRDEQGRVDPAIVVLVFAGLQLPFSSGGRPLAARDFNDDVSEIDNILRLERNPRFYSSLDPDLRTHLTQGVPQCH